VSHPETAPPNLTIPSPDRLRYSHLVPEPTLSGPFASVLVPYDGSEPSRAALSQALALLQPTSTLVILTVVDDSAIITESAISSSAYDPTPLFETFDAQGTAMLADAVSRCAKANITPVTELVHGSPVPAIVAHMKKHGCDLVVMGTHARTGVDRLFLGSTTEGVLRSSTVPVLTVRTTDAVVAHPFATVVLGIDDSDASDAAVALAKTFMQSFKTRLVACHAIDTTVLYENAAAYPYDLQDVLEEMRAEGAAIIARSLTRASIDAHDVTVVVVEGSPARVLLQAVQDQHATDVIVGSHGRRGLRRFFLGSAAEQVVRSCDVPVLVVRGLDLIRRVPVSMSPPVPEVVLNA
jgi:nucleotide-binding universal stress UspA family protein